MIDWLLQQDTRLFLFLNGLHNEFFDGIAWWVSGKTSWWPFYLVILGYLGWRKGWQLTSILFFVVLSIAVTDQTSGHLFKNLFHRLRPCHEPALEGLVHLVNNKCGGQFGFVSSHAANSFGVACLLIFWLRQRWFALVMLTWALLVSYSRIYLGVHYPGDVLAGALWGSVCGWMMYRLSFLIHKAMPENWWINRAERKSRHRS